MDPFKATQSRKKRLEASNRASISPRIKLEELITLSKKVQNGITKKMMFHVPTVTIYSILELPVVNKDRKQLKKMLSVWEGLNKKTIHIQPIFEKFWNCPEGYLSLLTTHMNAGTLSTLREEVGAVPELALSDIGFQILEGLSNL